MPLLDLFWALFIFFMWVIWIWLLITVFIDIFRDKSQNGFAKAAWVLFLILLPLLGVLVYLIARGDSMSERQMSHAVKQQQAAERYIRDVSGGSTSDADELEKLGKLHRDGVLSDEEFGAQKAKILG
ncbi:MAG: SHOCT domain-containing protein [Acidimicrobiia bacterium]|nr:MAG: SHOCT domain-containing protein [Acidimicrobiia bacterium]